MVPAAEAAAARTVVVWCSMAHWGLLVLQQLGTVSREGV